MTKTEATKRARAILSHGHYAVNLDTVRVKYRGEWVMLYGRLGRRPSHGEMVRQLAQAIVDDEYNRANPI